MAVACFLNTFHYYKCLEAIKVIYATQNVIEIFLYIALHSMNSKKHSRALTSTLLLNNCASKVLVRTWGEVCSAESGKWR